MVSANERPLLDASPANLALDLLQTRDSTSPGRKPSHSSSVTQQLQRASPSEAKPSRPSTTLCTLAASTLQTAAAQRTLHAA